MMSPRRRKGVSPEYAAKIAELAAQTEEAEEIQGIIEAREPFVDRLGAELRNLRVENHFTPLFIARIGAQR